jgi:hypothetical protein
LKRIPGLLLCTCAALALAGAAQGGLAVGVTEDAGKTVAGGGPFFLTMSDVGLTVNRVSVSWDPAKPTAIPAPAEIKSWLPQARARGVHIIFAVAPLHARDLTTSPTAPAQFVAFIQQLAKAFPQVTEYVIGNEPNQPRFWLPQFSATGQPISAVTYEPVLASAYDALKAINPAIRVIGVGLSPRGNDQPAAKNNVSRSPVRFLRDLGIAYRVSHRARPIMDGLAFHPYPNSSRDPLDKGYRWPNAGFANLDRIKQAVWDAFHGTSQQTFAETGVASKFAAPLTFDLDEVGWQVAIPAGLASFYVGTESVPTTDEATQAQIYSDLIKETECDPTVHSLSFFHLVDEADLDRWQSGLERADGSHRPSYDAIKETLAQTHGNCQGAETTWVHTTQVVAASVKWGNLRKARRLKQRRWGFSVAAGEEASFRAGIFKAGPRGAVLVRRLTGGRPKPLLRALGTIEAKSRSVVFPARRLKAGRYVYVIKFTSTVNPYRVSAFYSRAFRVGRPKHR